jgi:hypothetical protein
MSKKLITLFSIIISVMLLVPAASYSEKSDLEKVKEKLPHLLGANNVGTEFWLTIPPCYEEASGDNFVKLFITSPYETLVQISVPGRGLMINRTTRAHDVIEVNLTPTQGQPYTKATTAEPLPEQVFSKLGINITSEDPIVVYCVVRYQATSDGFLALPVSSLGREYIASPYATDPMFYAIWRMHIPSMVGIVAAYDDTQVRFKLGGGPANKTAGGMKPGDIRTFTMEEGDVLMVASMGDFGDLSGSHIIATKPVAVVSGVQCTNIPVGNQWCDYTVEMEIPTFTWGTHYHVPKIPNRLLPPLIRIFAKEPNTSLYRDGKSIGFLPEAGGMENKAYIERRLTPTADIPRSALIHADKPIGVTLYNPGVQEDDYPHPNSDPFVMVMTPMQQYQNEITFCTPGVSGSGFAENYLNLVYETTQFGTMPDHVEFAEVNSGTFEWQKLSAKFGGQDEMFSFPIDGKNFAAKTLDLPGEGVFKIRAQTPFAAYSFGYASYDSYGYPTSAALKNLEVPDTLPPIPMWDIDCAGNVYGNGPNGWAVVTDMPDPDSVRSNLSLIVFGQESENYYFDFKPFVAGNDRTTYWRLTTIDPTKDAIAYITFSDRAGNDTTLVVEYSAPKMDIRPHYEDYGLLYMDQVITKRFYACNDSRQYPIEVTQLELKKKDQGFVLDLLDNELPFTIPARDSIPFDVTFTATMEGTFQDSIGIGDTCFYVNKSLVDASVGEPTIEVTDYDYGALYIGDRKNREFTITNNGSVELKITGFTGPDNAEYKHFLPEMDEENPLRVPAGERNTANFVVEFSPSDAIEYPDQIVFHSNAREGDSIAVLNGRGLIADLEANGYDWGRRTIHRPEHPAGPYPPDDGERVIVLSNSGNTEVKIMGFEIISDQNGDAFKFDRNAIYSLSVPAAGEVYIPVEFQPTVSGDHELVISFDNTLGKEVITSLTGIGIVPRVVTENYDFGETIVNDVDNPTERTITFTNEEWEYQDELTITGFTVLNNANNISKNGTTYGLEGFTYDQSAIGLPVTLQPGESVSFDARFVAQRVGGHIADLETISDAQFETTSNWIAAGFERLIRGEGGSSYICAYDTEIIDCVIENYSETDIEVENISFDPIISEFTFVEPNDALGFNLAALSQRTIQIRYSPFAAGDHPSELVITSNATNTPELRLDLSGKADYYTRPASIVLPTEKDKNPELMDNVNVSIMLNGNNDLTLAAVTELIVTVYWTGSFLKVDENTIEVGSHLQGDFEILDIDIQENELSFRLVANGANILNGNGELAKFRFSTFLPKAAIPEMNSNLTMDIQAAGDNPCLGVEPTGNSLKLKEFCVEDLRLVIPGSSEYSLAEVTPNPVTNGGTNIEFSLGLTAWTELTIYNSMGEVVSRPISKILESGNYEVPIPVNDLTSGSYYIRLQSGPYTQDRKMIIAK